MRTVGLIALAMAIAACWSDSSTAPPPAGPLLVGTVRFTRDANTCGATPAKFTFFADGAGLGKATLGPGQSQTFSTDAGPHIFSIAVPTPSFKFSPVTGTVPVGGTFTYLMIC